ncbi:hypothetical protein MA16_Dca017916 [Dendrobium catenatum]|uniref:Uncharacterized protein n=1 Tax=Dendrobium catenatum TaxID=906689 RepID=A0A2I0W9U1_9ASPA|nr:hypothetical protein MA16_Dca017916 [Dendrobium catenatum]
MVGNVKSHALGVSSLTVNEVMVGEVLNPIVNPVLGTVGCEVVIGVLTENDAISVKENIVYAGVSESKEAPGIILDNASMNSTVDSVMCRPSTTTFLPLVE